MNIKKEINTTIAKNISADFYQTESGMVYCDVYVDGICVGAAFGSTRRMAFKEAICRAICHMVDKSEALYASDEPTMPTMPPPPNNEAQD